MMAGKAYTWILGADGRRELYARDYRVLASIAKHPRPLVRAGLPKAAARAIAREVNYLRSRARSESAHTYTVFGRQYRVNGVRPVLLTFSRMGTVVGVSLCKDSWRDLSARLTEMA